MLTNIAFANILIKTKKTNTKLRTALKLKLRNNVLKYKRY